MAGRTAASTRGICSSHILSQNLTIPCRVADANETVTVSPAHPDPRRRAPGWTIAALRFCCDPEPTQSVSFPSFTVSETGRGASLFGPFQMSFGDDSYGGDPPLVRGWLVSAFCTLSVPDGTDNPLGAFDSSHSVCRNVLTGWADTYHHLTRGLWGLLAR